MKIAIASDHAGYELKEYIKANLSEEIEDFGTNGLESVDYPDFAFPAARSVAEGKNTFGVLICGSGVGVSISANKVRGIRAANVFNSEMAKLSRQHNNANILTLAARFITKEVALLMVRQFIATEFEAGRHQLRLDKIHTNSDCK